MLLFLNVLLVTNCSQYSRKSFWATKFVYNRIYDCIEQWDQYQHQDWIEKLKRETNERCKKGSI